MYIYAAAISIYYMTSYIPHCWPICTWLIYHDGVCFQLMKDLFLIMHPSLSSVVIATTASLVVLWVATVTAFGVVTAVLSWQNFKLKQKGMLTSKPYR